MAKRPSPINATAKVWGSTIPEKERYSIASISGDATGKNNRVASLGGADRPG